jgi:hypothetical protein
MKIHTPPMQFLNDEVAASWEKGVANNPDEYGKAVYRYASEWATRMEAEMAQGKKISEIAKRTSREANDEGITGFMHGLAVSLLAQGWKYGEALRLWHNLETQIGTEGQEANEHDGRVLNPALLNVSTERKP